MKEHINKTEFFEYLDRAINPYSQPSSIRGQRQKHVSHYSKKQTCQYKSEKVEKVSGTFLLKNKILR